MSRRQRSPGAQLEAWMTSNASAMARALPSRFVFAVDVNIGGTWHPDCHVIYVREIVPSVWIVFDPNMCEGDETVFSIYRPAKNDALGRKKMDVVRRANIGDPTSKYVNACYKCEVQPNDSLPGISKGVCHLSVIAFHYWLEQYVVMAGIPLGLSETNPEQAPYYPRFIYWAKTLQAAVGAYFRGSVLNLDNPVVFLQRFLPRGFDVPKKILSDWYV